MKKRKQYASVNISGEVVKVEVMATSGCWAMVRRPRCIPFCMPLKKIRFVFEFRYDYSP